MGRAGEGAGALADSGQRRPDEHLRAFEPNLELAERALQDGERGRIVAPNESGHFDDAGCAGVADELLGERGADAAALVGVGDFEGDLRGRTGAHEPGDRNRLRVAVDVGDQRVVIRPHGREPAQLLLAEALLRPVEPRAARLLAQPLEDGLDGGRVAMPQRPDEKFRPALRLHDTCLHLPSLPKTPEADWIFPGASLDLREARTPARRKNVRHGDAAYRDDQLTVATDEIYEKYLQKAITESNALGDELAQTAGGARVPVLGSGHPLADVFLLKYAPQASELQEGVAFYGRAGTALLKSLQRLHVDPMAIYGTNCLKFAGGDEDESRPFLLRELHIVQPKLVVAMGEPSLAFLNAAAFPLSRELAPVEGELQEYTPTIQGLVTPDIDSSLDEQPAKTAFWNAFKVLGEWWSQTPPY